MAFFRPLNKFPALRVLCWKKTPFSLFFVHACEHLHIWVVPLGANWTYYIVFTIFNGTGQTECTGNHSIKSQESKSLNDETMTDQFAEKKARMNRFEVLTTNNIIHKQAAGLKKQWGRGHPINLYPQAPELKVTPLKNSCPKHCTGWTRDQFAWLEVFSNF